MIAARSPCRSATGGAICRGCRSVETPQTNNEGRSCIPASCRGATGLPSRGDLAAVHLPVPSPPSGTAALGGRERVRGSSGRETFDLLSDSKRTLCADSRATPVDVFPKRIPPHPNPLPPKTGGRGDRKRRPFVNDRSYSRTGIQSPSGETTTLNARFFRNPSQLRISNRAFCFLMSSRSRASVCKRSSMFGLPFDSEMFLMR